MSKQTVPKKRVRQPKRVKSPLRVYVAGPLSANTAEQLDKNIEVADEAAKALFLMGHWPFCPHTQSRTWHNDEREEFHDYEMLVDHHDIDGWLSICDAVLFLPGWKKSKGSVMEYRAAKEHGKMRFFSVDKIPEIVGWKEAH